MSITVAARSKVWAVFTRSNTTVVGSNLIPGMDDRVFIPSFCCSVCRQRPCDGLILNPRNSTDYAKD
jgi:hypothetical protein